MVRNKKIIIAIGGGGFTHSSDEDLDEFVINQVNKSKINIGFLPTASNDNQEKIDLFYNRFKSQKFKLSHFNLCSSVEGFNEWLLNKDIIYVGGGNTSDMINIWKRHNLIKDFKVFDKIMSFPNINHVRGITTSYINYIFVQQPFIKTFNTRTEIKMR